MLPGGRSGRRAGVRADSLREDPAASLRSGRGLSALPVGRGAEDGARSLARCGPRPPRASGRASPRCVGRPASRLPGLPSPRGAGRPSGRGMARASPRPSPRPAGRASGRESARAGCGRASALPSLRGGRPSPEADRGPPGCAAGPRPSLESGRLRGWPSRGRPLRASRGRSPAPEPLDGRGPERAGAVRGSEPAASGGTEPPAVGSAAPPPPPRPRRRRRSPPSRRAGMPSGRDVGLRRARASRGGLCAGVDR